MHRNNAAHWKNIVHDREHALLDFACVFGAADEDEFLGQVQGDERFVARSLFVLVGFERRDVDYSEVGCEVGKLVGCRADEEVASEKIRPGSFGVYAYGRR